MSTNIMESITGISSHQQAAQRAVGHEVEPQYLPTAEVAARLRLSTRTVREKIRTGVFRRGVHFFAPVGSQPRWKWSAVVAWMEGKGTGSLIVDERPRELKDML